MRSAATSGSRKVRTTVVAISALDGPADASCASSNPNWAISSAARARIPASYPAVSPVRTSSINLCRIRPRTRPPCTRRLFNLLRNGFQYCVGAGKHGLLLFHRLRRILMTGRLMPRYSPPVGMDGCRLPLPSGDVLSIGTGAGARSRYSPERSAGEKRRKGLDIDVYQAEPIAFNTFALPRGAAAGLGRGSERRTRDGLVQRAVPLLPPPEPLGSHGSKSGSC